MKEGLDTALVLADLDDKPSKQYRTSPYTVQEFIALPYNTRRAVDATCNEQEGISYTTYDDEASDKPFTVGRRPNTTPSTGSGKPAQLATPHIPHILAPTPDMTAYVHPAPSPALHFLNTPEVIEHNAAHPDNEHTSAVVADNAGPILAAVAGHYLNLIPYESNADWTHHSFSPYGGGQQDSFVINDRTGVYHCFLCGKTGTALDLVLFMEEEEVSNEEEALAWINANLSVSPTTPESVEIPPVAEGADGAACAYPGGPVPYPTLAPSLEEEEYTPDAEQQYAEPAADSDFDDLAQATAQVVRPLEHVPPTAIKGMVYKTTDYDMFHLLPENRIIDPKQVGKLVREIAIKNMLHIKPMDVTADMGIVDGQHRREAARELGVPIYYRIDDQLSGADIMNLNVASKNWAGTDYLHHFTVLGKPDYIALTEFMKRYPFLSFSNAVMLLQRTEENTTAEFRSGEWIASQEGDTANETADFIQRIVLEVPSFKQSKNSRFISAVLYCIRYVPGFSSERFLKKILQAPTKLVPCASRKQYMILFADIYNYNQNKELRINFL